MRVNRVYEKEVNTLKVGDQIQLGKYSATAVNEGWFGGHICVEFFLDQCLDKRYRHTPDILTKVNLDLRKDHNFKEIFDDAIFQVHKFDDGQVFVLPFAGEVFKKTDEWNWVGEHIEADYWDGSAGEWDDGWESMNNRKNRIASSMKDPYMWYWLMNKADGSLTYFAAVDHYGLPNLHYFYSSGVGVRPVFYLRKKME